MKRGTYLMLLEFTLVNFVLFFDVRFHTFIFEVIATIGFGFIILGLLPRWFLKTIGIAGLLIIFCHNLSAFIPFQNDQPFQKILSAFFLPGAFPLFKTVFIMAYPPVPWLGIMLVGFASGKFFELPYEQRKKLFIGIGLSALLLFIIIRFANVYGDSVRWSVQKESVFTFLSFINVTKYPPSLLFCLITLGIMFLILAFTETSKNAFIKILSVYVKFLCSIFLFTFFLIHIIMLAVMLLQGFHWSQLDFSSGSFGRPKGVESGCRLVNLFDLDWCYLDFIQALYLVWKIQSGSYILVAEISVN